MTTSVETRPAAAAAGATLVLFTLASGQFLMTLDSSVMNVSIATVAKDVGTTVTGIQGAITAYTLIQVIPAGELRSQLDIALTELRITIRGMRDALDRRTH